MATRVGIMGFGQTGRNVFRILAGRSDAEVVAICDVVPADQLLYLLKFDTLFGRFDAPVALSDGRLLLRGRPIRFWDSYPRGDVPPWGEEKVDVVLDCTARALTRDEAARHLEAGAGRVVVCTPSAGPVDVTAVRGFNDDAFRPEHRIVDVSSPTVSCVAPILAILKDAFGLERVFFDAIHAYTNAHRLADVPLTDKRRGRSAAENIIPQESRSEAMLTRIFPDLAGRLTGSAVDVPVANGSVVDLTCWHSRPVSPESIADAVRSAAAGRWKGVVACEEEPIVSSDVTRSVYPCMFDAQATLVLGERLSKTLCWIDAGWAVATRIVDVVAALARLGPAGGGPEKRAAVAAGERT
ncbi:MAG TPA: glyceraldehyde 3-phosphate dehydrogenase NAD-binding domain-containing protein [Thermoanaerobaculia bacterium]|nr:glyceraldehyde 3-phosphate dehydrogenase NAD-binding domain-containing protein [Thermoanaerobaculia bacterium]